MTVRLVVVNELTVMSHSDSLDQTQLQVGFILMSSRGSRDRLSSKISQTKMSSSKPPNFLRPTLIAFNRSYQTPGSVDACNLGNLPTPTAVGPDVLKLKW